MINASVPSPTRADTAAAPTNSHNRGLLTWRASTDRALVWWVRTAFGPKVSNRRSTSAELSPAASVPRIPKRRSGGIVAAAWIVGSAPASGWSPIMSGTSVDTAKPPVSRVEGQRLPAADAVDEFLGLFEAEFELTLVNEASAAVDGDQVAFGERVRAEAESPVTDVE